MDVNSILMTQISGISDAYYPDNLRYGDNSRKYYLHFKKLPNIC